MPLEDFISPQNVSLLQQLIGKLTPDIELGSTNPFDYREQAQREVEESGYFNKNLDLVKKSLEIVKRQRKESQDLERKQEEEDFIPWKGIQDRNFARTLWQAQSGHAGRGTFTSGFRGGEIANLQRGQEDVFSEMDRERRQAEENRRLGFAQFGETQDLQAEESTLGIERERETSTLQRQSQIASQIANQNQALMEQANQGFSRAVTFGKFLQGAGS